MLIEYYDSEQVDQKTACRIYTCVTEISEESEELYG